MSDQRRLAVQRQEEALILSKIRYFVDFNVWPETERMDPYRWLENFTTEERPYALNILNVFMYYNNRMVNGMFRSAIHSLCSGLIGMSSSRQGALTAWSSFLSDLTITYIQGESPNPTDSGQFFARKARQVLQVDQRRIMTPGKALEVLLNDPFSPIVFVDDFVGSGNQMAVEWCREYRGVGGESMSFASATRPESYVVYVPLVATGLGLSRIRERCPGLKVLPVHTIDGRYSLTSPESLLWPDELKGSARDMLRSASERAGILSYCEVGWEGFRELGLAIAFEHCVPDATIPLIFWAQNGWYPLVRRT